MILTAPAPTPREQRVGIVHASRHDVGAGGDVPLRMRRHHPRSHQEVVQVKDTLVVGCFTVFLVGGIIVMGYLWFA
jgi:hypothetical protein